MSDRQPDELVAERIAEARAAWPTVSVDDETIVAYVTARSGIETASFVELYLLCACGRGDESALAAFDDAYLSAVPGAVAHIGLSQSDVDEITQRIREKLFVAEPGQDPRIDDYAGGGSLRGLVKVMAVRDAISIVRKRTREVWNPDDELLRLPSEMADPELDSVKSQLRDHFRRAFEEAVDELSPRERNLLRMHLLEGVTLEQLGKSYSVHRVTITRWLAKARHNLFVATRRRLEHRAGTDVGHLDSFLGMVESRLDLSLSRILASR